MTPLVQGILIGAVAVLGILTAVSCARHPMIPVVEPDKDFTVRYPEYFFVVACTFFALFGCLLASQIMHRNFAVSGLILESALLLFGLSFLLIFVNKKIAVREDYLILIGIFRAKRFLRYKDIDSVWVGRYAMTFKSHGKNFRFGSAVVYKEDLLRRLRRSGIKVEREDV